MCSFERSEEQGEAHKTGELAENRRVFGKLRKGLRLSLRQHKGALSIISAAFEYINIDNRLSNVYYIDNYLFEGERGVNQYKSNAGLFKALADKNRLEILDMLSCGELCACMLLAHFHITQPTLSHHMKILRDCGWVSGRKEGKWIYYSLNSETAQACKAFLDVITSGKKDCICVETPCCEGA